MSRFFDTTNAPRYIASPVLYERKSVTQLWSRLTAVAKQQWKWKNSIKKDPNLFFCRTRFLLVFGPPGSGKSSATFCWVRDVCQRCTRNAYWISCSTEHEKCWLLENNNYGVGVKAIPASIPLNADAISDVSVVVFDGIRQTNVEKWRGMMNDLAREGIAVFIVSSEGVRFHDGDSGDIMKLSHFAPSWTLEKYHAACANDKFWESVHEFFANGNTNDDAAQRKRKIEDKYSLAGHSAQFMFDKHEVEIAEQIERDAESVDVGTLEEALRNLFSSGAINTVLARLENDKNGTTPNRVAELPASDDLDATGTTATDFLLLEAEIDKNNARTRLVSCFASVKLIENLPSNIEKLLDLAAQLSNRVIKGYAFEQQFEKSLKEAANAGLSLRLLDKQSRTTEYRVGKFMKCQADNLVETLGQDLEADTWIFVCGQQGAFGAVHVVSSTHIRFVQATVGIEQGFFLDTIDNPAIKFVAHRTWSHMEFMLLRPENERFVKFSQNPARGKLRPYQPFDNQPRVTTDYRKNVIYRYLRWNY